jgi:hypothetical protein
MPWASSSSSVSHPCPPARVAARDLRSDLRELTPEERVDQAMQLSEFLTDLEATARNEQRPE